MFNVPSFMGFDKAGFGTPIDPDAAAFFARVTAAGGTLSATEQTAVNTLVVQMKADGIWTAMKAIYPMVGASAAACAQNLKSASFPGTFFGLVNFASTGVTGNGSSGYMNSGFVPSTNGLTYDNNHISFYSRTTAFSGNDFFEIGSSTNSSFTDPLGLWSRRTNDSAGYDSGSTFTNRSTFSNTDGKGFYCGTAVTTTSKFFKNGVNQVSFSLTASAISSVDVFILAFNEGGGNIYYSTKELAFASMGNGLTDTQASNFYTAVQAFQTTLGRQV